MRRAILIIMVAVLTGCTPALTPQQVQDLNSGPLYTCCNIHFESNEINDANYYVGKLLPLGTPVRIDEAVRGGVTFTADGTKLTLYLSYGVEEESFEQYINKVLVRNDPKVRLATFSKEVREAITNARVERGMTKEQVLMSLGYPPTHRTPTTDSNHWIYWDNRWTTYNVDFDSNGRVSRLTTRAPSIDKPVR